MTSGGSTHPRFPDSADRGVVKETQGDKAAGAQGLMTPHPRLSRVTPCALISGSRRRRCVGDTLTRHCETLVILAPLTGKGCGLSSEVTSCLPQLPTAHCNDARRLPRQRGQGSAIARVRQGHWHSLCGIGAPCAITARIPGKPGKLGAWELTAGGATSPAVSALFLPTVWGFPWPGCVTAAPRMTFVQGS